METSEPGATRAYQRAHPPKHHTTNRPSAIRQDHASATQGFGSEAAGEVIDDGASAAVADDELAVSSAVESDGAGLVSECSFAANTPVLMARALS